MSKSKNDRLMAIREIVAMHDISGQDEILEELANRGYFVTQATLSRDIKELQIAKVPDGMGNYRYRTAPNTVARQSTDEIAPVGGDIIRNCAVSIEFSGQIAVLKTRPGYASVIADMIDKAQFNSIMGTLAGDDTVLIIMRQKSTPTEVVIALSQWLPDIEEKALNG